MHLLISGGTGFLGRPLVHHLRAAGHSCVVLTRNPARAAKLGVGDACSWEEPLPRFDAVVHLAGESVVGWWTPRKRAAILSSRIETTRRLIAALERHPPKVFLGASAVGYYGDRPGERLTEISSPDPRRRFRSAVCQAWEEETSHAASFGSRVVNLRLGNVLHPSGGYLGAMLPFHQLGLGAIMGERRALLSWISLHDAIRLIAFALDNTDIRGPVNLTAPAPVSQAEFARTVSNAMGNKVRIRIPALCLRVVLGEFSTALLDNQNVIPEKALQHRFCFRHRTLQDLAPEVPGAAAS